MTENRSVLVVDDDAAMREMLISLLEEGGFEAVPAASADLALQEAKGSDFAAVLSDIRMPGHDGFELLGQLRELRPDTPVILMTAFGSIDSAVEAMRAGAFDYITKPFKREAVLATLERAFERRALEAENRRLRRAVDQTSAFGDLIGTSPAMREIFALIKKISSSRSSVLITGDSGTGKEVVARTIHFTGNRADRPFVPINCTAMPEGLLESELFGHARGAFTGAHTAKRGLFEEADGGTLFLDEIGDMPPLLQSKLLRVVQDREIRPNSSLSSSPSGMAVQLIGTKGRSARFPVKWIVRATTSLPVPLSPVIRTLLRLLEIFLIRAKISRMAGLVPIRSPKALVWSTARRSRRFSASRALRSKARSSVARTASRLNGLVM